MSLPEHVARNRAAWDGFAVEYVEPGHRAWAENEVRWGIWQVPEADVGMFPTEVAGLDVVELGCGTGYVSSWLARRGARPVGIDNSERQLDAARRFQEEFGVAFPLVHGNAEETPFADASFDLAVSEYGACLWCDPYRWVPEAARLLRPGGRLVFLTNSALFQLCADDVDGVPADERLKRDYFGMHRQEWPDDPSVEFHLGHGDWFRVLRESGFDVEDLVEIRPPEGSTTRYPYVTLDWARRFPSEEVWKARKRA